MGVFLVKTVFFISNKFSLHVFRRHGLQSIENGRCPLCHLKNAAIDFFIKKKCKLEITTFRKPLVNLCKQYIPLAVNFFCSFSLAHVFIARIPACSQHSTSGTGKNYLKRSTKTIKAAMS